MPQNGLLPFSTPGWDCEFADRLPIPAHAAQRLLTGAAAAMPTDVGRRPLQASRQMSTKQ
jgi:hypothetical protein